MTIGLGIVTNFGALLGCDQQETQGGNKDYTDDKHLEVRGLHAIIAGSSAGRYFAASVLASGGMLGAMHYPVGETPWSEISVRAFSRVLRSSLEEYGWLPELKPGTPPYWELSMLLTDGRRLFEINTALIPREVELGRFVSIGVGWDTAQAVITGFEGLAVPEAEVARVALETTIRHALHCGGEARLHTVAPSEGVRLVW